DHQFYPCIDCLQNSVCRACCRNKNDRHVAMGFLASLPHRVENRHGTVKHLSTLAWRYTGHDVCSIIHALPGVKSTGTAGNSLHDETSILIDQDRHEILDFRFSIERTPIPESSNSSLRSPLMNQELVSIGIAELSHPANRCFNFLHIESHAALFELVNCL